jgi:cardiolipin synthase
MVTGYARPFSSVSFRAPRLARLAALLILAIPAAGCSYIFSEKRTVYEYEPAYGVDSSEFRRSLDAFGTEMVAHNRATLLQNGDEIFEGLAADFRGARVSINLEAYIFDHGSVATRLARVLAEKARQGVEVRVLVDGFGSSLGVLADEMEAAGVKVAVYKPLRIYSLYKVGNRTHRRIFTVDGRIGFCGGVGIDDRWLGDARNPSEWRETLIRVEGPVVAQLQHIFFEDWVHTTGEVLHGSGQFPNIEPAGDVLAQAISSSRTDQSSMAKLQYYMAIQAARHRIWIENAYFVPDRQIRQGLTAAVARGVDVRILVPGKYIDSPNVRNASRFHYGELLDGGVQVFEYLPIWSSIGSINFVNRSMRKNGEASVSVYDRRFAERVETMVEADLARSERFTKEMWKKRGALARFGELFFWLFSENY